MKRSKQVPLVLIGFVAISGCDESINTHQDYYKTKEECMREWDKNPNSCNKSTGGTSGGAYVGPRYYWDRESNSLTAVDDSGSRTSYSRSPSAQSSRIGSFSSGTVTRGGFGSFGGRANSFSAGG